MLNLPAVFVASSEIAEIISFEKAFTFSSAGVAVERDLPNKSSLSNEKNISLCFPIISSTPAAAASALPFSAES